MKYFFIFIFTLGFSLTNIRADSFLDGSGGTQFIGLQFSKLPAGLEEGEPSGVFNDSVNVQNVKSRNADMLWLEKVIDHDSAGVPSRWEVVDAVLLPSLDKNEFLVMPGTSGCRFGGGKSKPRKDLFGIAQSNSKEKDSVWLKTSHAWEVNLKTLKLDSPVANVECISMVGGD